MEMEGERLGRGRREVVLGCEREEMGQGLVESVLLVVGGREGGMRGLGKVVEREKVVRGDMRGLVGSVLDVALGMDLVVDSV